MRMQVILDSSFARPGSAPIWGGKKGEFRDWTNSSTTLQPSALLSAIWVNFWRLRINSFLPSTIKLVKFLCSETLAEVNLSKIESIYMGIMSKLPLVTFEFHESNLLVHFRFPLDLVTPLIQFNFKIAFGH